MKLSDKLTIDSIEYASQGNAILGMKGSGKSYTATYIAERLMDEGIPFVAFDPIGIWHNLKVGRTGPGYPVVVAGGEHGDLPLSPESAPDIVRAAMGENVSLVLDLYSMNLSKKDWRTIVEKCIRLLLYQNKPCGLRHIFIEEAPEFVPQRVQPEYGGVYAEIEKLARMGGNASLGYTLIGQRPEEINKSVLELCDCLFLHRQKGRHSLTAIEKWLNVADANEVKAVINSLPSLPAGDCWVWSGGSHDPQRVHILPKKTVHPDRKNPLQAGAGVSSDVSKFVETMQTWLVALTAKKDRLPERAGKSRIQRIIDESDVYKMKDRIKDLTEQLDAKNQENIRLQAKADKYMFLFDKMREMLNLGEGISAIETHGLLEVHSEPKKMVHVKDNGSVQAGPLRYLKAAAMFYPNTISKKRISALAGTSFKSSTHRAYMAYLKKEGLIEAVDSETFRATKKGMSKAGEVEALPTRPAALIEMWAGKLGQGPAIYLRTLAAVYPNWVQKPDLAKRAGTEYTKSTHRAYMAELNAMGLVEARGNAVKLSDEIFN